MELFHGSYSACNREGAVIRKAEPLWVWVVAKEMGPVLIVACARCSGGPDGESRWRRSHTRARPSPYGPFAPDD